MIEQHDTSGSLPTSQHFLQRLTATIPDMLYVYDFVERRTVYVNRAVTVVLGYTPEAIQAMEPAMLRALLHPENQAGNAQQQLIATASDDDIFTREIRVQHANGEWRWLALRETVFARDAQGTPIQILGIAQDITEHKQTEDAYRLLVDHSLQGLGIVQEGNLVFVNAAGAKMTGYTIEEMLQMGHTHLDTLVHPADRVRLARYHQARMQGHAAPTQYEYRIIRKDGTIRWVESYAVAIQYQGRPASQIAFVDITERKQAEAELRKLQLAVEHSPSSIIITDNAGQIEYVNPCFTSLTGYSAEEVQGKNPRILQSDFTPLETYAELWATISSGSAWHGEFCNRKKNGMLYWETAAIAPMYDDLGQITHFVAVKEDITERKQMEEALRQSQSYLQAIFDNAAVGIGVADAQGRFLDLNRYAVELLGYTVDEFRQMTHLEPTHPDDRAVTREQFQALLRGDIPYYRLEKRYLRRDGRIIWVELSVTPIRGVDGAVETVIGIFADITGRKQAEEALRATQTRMNFLFESSPAVIFSLRLGGNYETTFVSPNVTVLTGYQPEDFVGNGSFWATCLHPDDVPGIFARRLHFAEHGWSGEEYRFRRRDGVYIWMRDEVRLVRGADGQPEIIGYWIDITGRKQVEEALRENQALLQGLLDHSPTSIALLDPAGRFLLANRRLLASIGLTDPQQIIGKTVTDLLPPDVAQISERERERVMQMKTPLVTEMDWQQRDGTHTGLVFTFPLINETGAIYALGSISTDITGRKQAEEEIQRRDAILYAMGVAAERFLGTLHMEQDIPLVLERLGRATGVSRVYLFENSTTGAGTLVTSQRFEWCAPGLPGGMHTPLMQQFAYQDGFVRWEALLSRGEPLSGRLADFPVVEQAILAPQQIRSLVAVPIFVGPTWWGFIGFNEYQQDRIWSLAEIEALKATAGIIGAAMQRAQIEHALKRSEERFRMLAEHAPDIISRYRLQPPLGYEYVSPSSTTILGYTPAEYYADPEIHWYIVHPDDRRILKDVVQAAVSYGEPFTLRCISKQGDIRWMEHRGWLVRDEAGVVIAVETIARDVTERKRMEAEMRTLNAELEQRVYERTAELVRSEARSRALLAAIPDSMFLFHRDGTILEFMTKDPDRLYIPPDQIIGSNLYEIMPPDFCAHCHIHSEQAFAERTPQLFEYQLLLVDGSRDFEARLIVYDTDQILAIVRDITERTRAEAALRESETRYRTLVETLPNSILLTDLDSTIRFGNQQAARLFGYAGADELVGHRFMDRFAPDTIALAEPYAIFEAEMTRNLECTLRRRDGSHFPSELNSAVVKNAQGERMALIIVVSDITERKQMQARIIASERFVAAGRLVASVAHEINTPLQALQTFLDLTRIAPEPERRMFLDSALQEVQRVARIVEQLLDLYRPRMANPGLVDIESLIDRILLLLGKRIKEQRVKVERTQPADLSPIWGRADELTQVLLNLLVNALDAMPGGGVLRLRCQENAEELCVAVSDTGNGLKPSLEGHIFEPFVTTKEKGIGLGLHISHQIIQQHGGKILVESFPGVGCIFTVVLPLTSKGSAGTWRDDLEKE